MRLRSISVSGVPRMTSTPPRRGFRGTETFTYTVKDGHGGTATGRVTLKVTRAASRIGPVTVSPRPLTRSDRALVTFRVRSDGTAAAGRYVIRDGRRVVGSGRLDGRGVARERIRRLGVGTHRLRVVYTGSWRSQPDAKVVRVRVVRR